MREQYQAVRDIITPRKFACRVVGMGLVLAGLALTWASVAAPAAAGPAPSGPFKSYINKNPFYLPVLIDERVRKDLREVQLYVKEHPAQPWVLKEKVPAAQTSFTFQAPRDGEYYFTVVTVDRAGRSLPADLAQVAASQVVILDTQVPQVDIQPLPPTPEGLPVTCMIRDGNLDAAKTKYFFQTGDKVWRQLEALPGHADRFCVPVQAAFTGLVSIAAADLAGNSITREFNLGGLPVATTAASASPAAQRSGSPATLPESIQVVAHRQVSSGSMPANAPISELGPAHPSVPTSAVSQAKASPSQSVAPEPVPAKEATPPATPAPLPPNIINLPQLPTTLPNCLVVNGTHLSLEYRFEETGASGVGKVEIWLTRDKGQTWKRLCEDQDRHSPVEIDLPGEGLCGLNLVASNGRGFGAKPPTLGDPCDWWIEVDTTAPVAEQLLVRPLDEKDMSKLLITWTARDRNLGQTPIDLYHAPDRDGPWQPIAKGLKNEGFFHWTISPALGPQAFVRLVVQDKAGNSTTTETPQPVLLDDKSRPRVRVTGVTTASPKVVPVSSRGD